MSACSTTAVAAGDLSKKINVEAFGEILQLKASVLSEALSSTLIAAEHCQ
jgi:HAMP domain-containing protein